ncbi:hypothetical protein [Pseudalkalibacillus caeni]|uniref:Type II secretion system protein n=1 Tax=Exobacillus caeni TaxID=2574798 RepID=A0A5R9FC43_9BACL|nr:hypothetical protein [Pseudalkalibacillus caeni]TLS39228.1 hypothetical protein FCL54_02670 [Pseudalkalibacillus caeni]
MTNFLKNDGITLVEVLLSLTLLTVILLTFAGLFVQGSNYSEKNERKLEAINLARKHLEITTAIDEMEIEEFKNAMSNSNNNIDQNYYDRYKELLSQCSGSPETGYTYCTDLSESFSQFKIWRYIKEAPPSLNGDLVQSYPVTVKVYYNNSSIAETYGYYFP